MSKLMLSKPKLTDWLKPEKLMDLIAGRKIYIWGARHDGYALRLALMRYGVSASSLY